MRESPHLRRPKHLISAIFAPDEAREDAAGQASPRGATSWRASGTGNSPASLSCASVGLGALEPESAFNNDGTITMVISADKVGGAEAGDLIGGLVARTYPVRQNQTLRGDSAADSATFAATYGVVGNAFCQNPPPTINCFEDDDAHVAYSKGWHRVSDPDASAGHFRFNMGRDSTQGLSFTFDVPEGDQGTTGSLRNPRFGFSVRLGGLAAGARKLELRNLQGVACVDRFCLESAFSCSP